jgi:hypothetical protein
MLHNRFRELIEASSPVAVTCCGGSGHAFVPCPVFGFWPAAQQSWVQEVYRLAAEQTRQQLEPPPVRFRWPAFSLN